MREKQLARFVILGGLAIIPNLAVGATDKMASSLSVAGGIAMPSYATSVFQNPGALVGTPGVNVEVQAGADSQMSNNIFRGGVGYGTGTAGITAGVASMGSSGGTSGYFGLAVGVEQIKTSFGLAGFFNPNSGSTQLNLGASIGLGSPLTIGLTAMGINQGSSEFGAGVAFAFASSAAFVVDTAFSQSGGFLGVAPGLKVGNDQIALMVAYNTGTTSSVQLGRNELSAGFSMKVKDSFNWELYYNRFATYYTAFSIRI